MTTNHIKAILTSLRAMVIKMLPAYKFYLGSTTETVATQIGHGVMSVEDGQTQGQGALTIDDMSFAGFVAGETYTAVINGVSGEYVAKLLNGNVMVTNIAELENMPENGWAVGFLSPASGEPYILMYMVFGSYANATISISQTKTVTTKKYQTKKLDKSLLPDGVESGIEAANTKATTALSAAQAAQNTANEAISSANTAQSTANTAKSTADAAAPKENPAFTGTFSQNRKPNTTVGIYSHAEGADTTASGNFSHAEGDDTIAASSTQHVQGKFNIKDTAGKYAHIVGNGTSTAYRSNAHTLDWDGVPWYKGRPQFGGTAQDNGAQTVVGNGDKEIILASSTSGSTKKIRITVDDTGTLTATEVTDA